MEPLLKYHEGRPNCVDRIKSGSVTMVINTTLGKKSIEDSYTIRRTALTHNVAYQTTVEGAEATVTAIEENIGTDMKVKPLQDYFKTTIDS